MVSIIETISVKGHKFLLIKAKDSFNRRALQYKNKLITSLGKLGVKRDDVDLELDGYCGRNDKAVVTWYHNKHRMEYKVESQVKYVDNLFIVAKVIEHEVELVLSEQKPLEEFINEYSEDEDVGKERKAAREYFGLEEDHMDIEEVNKKYKELAKTHHPDTPTGNVDKFKELNHHHKILKRELA